MDGWPQWNGAKFKIRRRSNGGGGRHLCPREGGNQTPKKKKKKKKKSYEKGVREEKTQRRKQDGWAENPFFVGVSHWDLERARKRRRSGG